MTDQVNPTNQTPDQGVTPQGVVLPVPEKGLEDKVNAEAYATSRVAIMRKRAEDANKKAMEPTATETRIDQIADEVGKQPQPTGKQPQPDPERDPAAAAPDEDPNADPNADPNFDPNKPRDAGSDADPVAEGEEGADETGDTEWEIDTEDGKTQTIVVKGDVGEQWVDVDGKTPMQVADLVEDWKQAGNNLKAKDGLIQQFSQSMENSTTYLEGLLAEMDDQLKRLGSPPTDAERQNPNKTSQEIARINAYDQAAAKINQIRARMAGYKQEKKHLLDRFTSMGKARVMEADTRRLVKFDPKMADEAYRRDTIDRAADWFLENGEARGESQQDLDAAMDFLYDTSLGHWLFSMAMKEHTRSNKVVGGLKKAKRARKKGSTTVTSNLPRQTPTETEITNEELSRLPSRDQATLGIARMRRRGNIAA